MRYILGVAIVVNLLFWALCFGVGVFGLNGVEQFTIESSRPNPLSFVVCIGLLVINALAMLAWFDRKYL